MFEISLSTGVNPIIFYNLKWPSLIAKIGKTKKSKFGRIDYWCQSQQHFTIAFMPISFRQKVIPNLQAHKISYKKAAQKMLVKLTTA
jgi:hypothetical protein